MTVFFSNKVKQFIKILYTCYLRLVGQSLEEVMLNSLLILGAAVYHHILFGQWVGIFHNTFLVVFLFEMFILFRAIYWIIRYGRRKKYMDIFVLIIQLKFALVPHVSTLSLLLLNQFAMLKKMGI
jgi:hypothetical protein